MSAARIWWAAARPRTLPAAAAPVLMGTGMAHLDGAMYLPAALAALLGALLLQIGTNFANDYYDFRKGADTDERLGPTRATAAGLVRPEAMKRAFLLTFAAALGIGIYLIARGGVPILVIGIASIACGILYTGGPRPFGYLGLGDVLVLIFFGPVALAGTHYVQTLHWSTVAIVAGLGPGMLATSLLAVNNLRDVESDRRAGKLTLAVRFGRSFAKAEYIAGVAIAALMPIALWLHGDLPVWCLLASATCLTAAPAVREVARAAQGDRLLPALAATGRCLALYGVVFTAACITG